MLEHIERDLEEIRQRLTDAGIECQVHSDVTGTLRGKPVILVQYDFSDFAQEENKWAVRGVNHYQVILAVPPLEDDSSTPAGFGSAFAESMKLSRQIVSIFSRREDRLRLAGAISVDRVSNEPVSHNGVLVSVTTIELSFSYPVADE